MEACIPELNLQPETLEDVIMGNNQPTQNTQLLNPKLLGLENNS